MYSIIIGAVGICTAFFLFAIEEHVYMALFNLIAGLINFIGGLISVNNPPSQST